MRRCPICDHSPVMQDWYSQEEQVMEYTCDYCLSFMTEEEVDQYWEERLMRENWEQANC